MPEDKIGLVIGTKGEEPIRIKVGEVESIEELTIRLHKLIELINDRKERASTDVTRINLDKARKLCEEIMREKRLKNNIF